MEEKEFNVKHVIVVDSNHPDFEKVLCKTIQAMGLKIASVVTIDNNPE